MLEALHDWLTGWADSPAGPAALGMLSASEAVFFPLPPDPLLIALALAHPERALLYGALATAASVAGGLVGHGVGMRLGRPVLQRHRGRNVERVERLFKQYGLWAVVIAGFTPLPFKLFTIAAGVFGMPRASFLLASLVGRAGRFMLISALIFVWGDQVREFLDEHFDLVMWAIGLALVAVLGVWVLQVRRSNATRRRSPATGDEEGNRRGADGGTADGSRQAPCEPDA